MSEFDENKGKRSAERLDRPPAAVRPMGRADSVWIGQVLRRRYDSALSEQLPDSFIALLDELDRKNSDKKTN
jgi:hypothetical protein